MSSIKTTQIDGDVSVGRNVATGGDVHVAGKVTVEHNLLVKGWLNAPNIKSPCKGLFMSLAELVLAYPSASVGDWAMVNDPTTTEVFPAKIYSYRDSGVWTDTGETTDGYESFDIEVLERLEARMDDAESEIAALEGSKVYRRSVFRYFADDVFTETGLMRANGTISPSTYYLHTVPLSVADVERFMLHTKLVGETATSFFPIVVWLDGGGNVVGYVDCTAGEGDYVLTPPAGAVAAVFNSLRTFVTQTDNVVCHADIVSAQPFAARVYISPEGSDANSGLTADAPVLTIRRANTLLAPDGELVMLAGDYYDLPLDLSNYGRLTGSGRVRIISGYQITQGTAMSGYTRVLCATIDKPPTRGTYLWQHDVADAATAIAPDEVHPVQEGATHRLPSTRIYPAASITEIEESTDVLKWYVSGTTLYFSKADGTDLATHPVVIPRRTISGTVGGTTEVRNVAFLYAPLLLTAMHGVLENVSAGMTNAAGAIRYDGATDFTMRRCEAYGCSNDGFNGHGTADNPSDIVLEDCWGHDNSDDGESCHEHCTVTSRGGLYEYNGSGCTPASGGRAAYYGTMARQNLPTHAWTGSSREGTGFSAQGAAPSGAETAMTCHACYATANSTGIRTTLASGTHAIACISTGNGTDYAGSVERLEADVELHSAVEALEADIEGIAGVVFQFSPVDFTLIDNKIIEADTGLSRGGSTSHHTDYVKVSEGETYLVSALFYSKYGIAGYSSASESGYCANIASLNSPGSIYNVEIAEDFEIVIPSGVEYIRVSTFDKTNYPVSLKRRISVLEMIEKTESELSALEDEVESLSEAVGGVAEYQKDVLDLYPKEGYWRYNSSAGTVAFAPVSDWHCTNLIPCEAGDEFDIVSTILIGASVHALFDENKAFIGLLQTEIGTQSLTHFTITEEQYAAGARYVAFSFKPADTPSVLLKKRFSAQETEERLSALEEAMSDDIVIFDEIKPVYAFAHAAPLAFRNKLALMNKDIEILMVGDSVTAYTHVVSTDEEADAANRPCGMQRNGLTWLLWNSLCNNKPQCDRFDSEVNAFTENGTFALSDPDKFNNRGDHAVVTNGNVGEFNQDCAVYRETANTNAAVSFNWNLDDFEKLAFIHRLGCDGTTQVRITCTANTVEVYDETTENWLEANNYTFSQFIQYVTPSAGGSSCWVRQMILKFRKVANATGTISLTFTNTGSGTMYYWGTERWNGNTLRVINLGKGGRSSSLHLYTLHDEIAYRHPDMVIYQMPVWNELKAGGDFSANNNAAHRAVIDLIKAQSDNWSKYQMMIFIPHTQVADWDGDRNKRFQANGDTSRPLTDEVSMTEVSREEYVLSQYDAEVPIFNLNPCIIDFAHSLGIDMETLLGSTSSAITDGTTSEVNVTDKYTADGVHMSATGAKFTANCLLPILR